MTERELKIQALRDEADQLEKEFRAEIVERYSGITLEMVNIFAPKHDYMSCDDLDLNNKGRSRCSRCSLLYGIQTGIWNNLEIRADVEHVKP